jgi:hypothetical protein
MKSKDSPYFSFAGEDRSAGVCAWKNVFNMPTNTCRDVTAEQDRDPMANAARQLWVPEFIYCCQEVYIKYTCDSPTVVYRLQTPPTKLWGKWSLLLVSVNNPCENTNAELLLVS